MRTIIINEGEKKLFLRSKSYKKSSTDITAVAGNFYNFYYSNKITIMHSFLHKSSVR